VVTVGASSHVKKGAFSRVADALVCGEETLDVNVMLDAFAKRGLRRVLREGGSTLFGTLLDAARVDELCLTVSPLLEAGDARRILAGAQSRHAYPYEMFGAGESRTPCIVNRHHRPASPVGPAGSGPLVSFPRSNLRFTAIPSIKACWSSAKPATFPSDGRAAPGAIAAKADSSLKRSTIGPIRSNLRRTATCSSAARNRGATWSSIYEQVGSSRECLTSVVKTCRWFRCWRACRLDAVVERNARQPADNALLRGNGRPFVTLSLRRFS
jgi:hypothetical protein